MNAGWAGIRVILSLELRQRVRGVAWYVLLGISIAVIGLVTLLLALTLGAYGDEAGAGIYSTIVYFVLLLGSLVTPALSGNAINGDREAGTLATTQVTLITTTELVIGKFLAAWICALAFLVGAIPFLLISVALGGLQADTALSSIAVLAVELGVVSAIGVGLSGLLRRPLFSIVVTYLAVATLSVGTLIAFVLGGLVVQTSYTVPLTDYDFESGDCVENGTTTVTQPRFDLVWGALASNPYVIVADAAPTHYSDNGGGTDDYPVDLFGYIKLAVRSAQQSPDPSASYGCDDSGDYPSPREVIEGSAPSWFFGLAVHVVLAGCLLAGAVAANRTPAQRLAAGSRIA